MKICSKCKEAKDKSDFHKDKSKKDGLRFQCKECQSQYDKARNARPEVKECRTKSENKERQKQNSKKWYSKPENKERRKQYSKEYNSKPENKERKKQRNAKPENKERKKEYDARSENKERKKEYNARPEIKEKNNQRAKERYYIDPQIKIHQIFSKAIRNGLKKNCGSKRGSSILSKLPYTMQELKQHLESLFESWMNWENHGSYNSNHRTWQIDHIIPHSYFHYESMNCEEFQKCWALSNLRPLETIANIKKSNKLI